jgi:hypothetical protein
MSLLVACLIAAGPVRGEDSFLEKWSSRVIPLPKQLQVQGSKSVSRADVVLVLPQSKDPLLTTAAGVLEPLATGAKGFEIQLVLTTEMSSRCPPHLRKSLANLPNRDQAYAIQPIENGGKFGGLVLAAITPLGLLYAARTLAQLVSAPSHAGETVEFPRCTLLDWPDLAERGEWFAGENFPDLQWMADRKFNVIEIQPPLGFSADGSPQGNLDQKIVDKAAALGIEVVPIIWHMEQLASTGLFRYHPEVASTPDPSKPLPLDYEPGVCFSQPKTIEILSAWMRQFLALPGVNEVMVWVSEEASPCYCPLCKGREPYGTEVKGIQEAFERARQGRPGVTLQILTTQGSYTVNDKILAAASPETRIVYYDGGRTYDSSHRPMIYPLLESFARSGHWLGVYPQLTNSWRTVFPFTGPQFMRARMQEFVDKRLNGVFGYATPSNRYYQFNVTASAEWSWNSRGRSPRQFSEAYASRVGIPHPELFGEWAEMIGDVGWDLAGGRAIQELILPGPALFKDKQFRDSHKLDDLQPMQFGQGLISEFPDRQCFEARRELAAQALKLAQADGDEGMVDESRSVLGALRLLDGLVELSDARSLPEERKLAAATEALAKLDSAAQVLTNSVYRWGTTVNPLPQGALPSRLRDTVDFAPAVASVAWEIGRDLGIKDPYPAYRLCPLREWNTEDISSGTPATLWAQVPRLLEGPGEYNVRFQFLDGDVGLDTHSVALLLGRVRNEEKPLDEERWAGHAELSTWVDYWLSVPKGSRGFWKPGDPLFLRLEVSAPSRERVSGKRTSHGMILISKSWRGDGEGRMDAGVSP